MNKYPICSAQDLPKIAKKWREVWKRNKTFQQTLIQRSESKRFNFYEGPPSANGKPGIHHAMARTIKDIFCRYKTQAGYLVDRKAGWDTHGLPVELQVEKQLKITKEDIGKKISIEDYNQACKETVMRYQSEWNIFTEHIGYWVDLSQPYITCDQKYIESVWALLKKLYEKKLLYKGYTIQPYSPAAGTGLSAHELNQPGCYRNVKDVSIVAQFKVDNTLNDFFLAWTTTPWTLPANSALAVGKNITYVKVETFNLYTHKKINVILAKDAVSRYFTGEQSTAEVLAAYSPMESKQIPWRIVDSFLGETLLGTTYEQLMPYIVPSKPAFKVIEGDFIDTAEGTGIVHIAPTFGADDMRVAKKAGIPSILAPDEEGNEVPIVDKQGRFISQITDYAGRYVKAAYEEEASQEPTYKSADVQIAIELKKENKAFRVEKYEHSYPHCWRTDKPILYYPLDSWFIKTTAYKDKFIELNQTINWQPPSTGLGRFGNWLENLVDWNLSRSRFWGTPLPIWRTEDQLEEKCIGSIAELQEEVNKSIKKGYMEVPIGDGFDPHRPYVDDIILVSPTGKKMYREPDLIDVWFDSGAMPYAQFHYPFENQEFFSTRFPADFIAEGIDQTRGWFFTLHAIAVMLFDSVAFKNVITNGLVLDREGVKMSKRLGNVIEPMVLMKEYGPDVLRWYIISNSNPWDNLKFDVEELNKVKRKFFLTLFNTYSFFSLYANLDSFKPNLKSDELTDGATESDFWIISKLHHLIQEVIAAYEAYDITKVARKIQDFVVEELSNWYVRLNRKRFWKSEPSKDKHAAYHTLYSCLYTISKITAPIAPFYMEELYHNLNSVTREEPFESVHLTNLPKARNEFINFALEEKMGWVQTITSLVHALRKKHKIKVRQPLAKLLIPVGSTYQKKQIQSLESLILSEVNVKAVEYISDENQMVKRKAVPVYKKLGKQYANLMRDVAQAIQLLNQQEIKQIEEGKELNLTIQGQVVKIGLGDIEIIPEDIPGWVVASTNGITVALDVQITDELRIEGVARELVNRIQNLRKTNDLNVQDKIELIIERGNQWVTEAFRLHKEYIQRETQALEVNWVDSLDYGTTVDLDGKKVCLAIRVYRV